MAEKRVILEELARSETATAQQLELKRKRYHEGQVKLAKDVPARFFVMARQLKEGVARFNSAARLDRVIRYTESAAVTTQDQRPSADLVVEISRAPNSIVVALRSLWRLVGEDAQLIEAEGVLGFAPKVDTVAVRIQGVYNDSELRWRITSANQPIDTPIDELPERIVAAVATGELARLWVNAPFV